MQTTVWREFHNGFNILGSTRRGSVWLKYCNIPSPGSSQPSSCSGHLQFQYSTSLPEQNILMRMASAPFSLNFYEEDLIVMAFNQSFNCYKCDLSQQTDLQLMAVASNFLPQSQRKLSEIMHLTKFQSRVHVLPKA